MQLGKTAQHCRPTVEGTECQGRTRQCERFKLCTAAGRHKVLVPNKLPTGLSADANTLCTTTQRLLTR